MTPIVKLLTVMGGGPPARRIARWFASTEGGMWDATNNVNLDQASTQGTPVTASGDLVGYMADLGGRGYHFKQSTAGARPTYREDSSGRYIHLNGNTSWMKVVDFNLAGATKSTVVVAIRQSLIGTTGAVVIEGGAPSAAGGGVAVYLNNTTSGAIGGGLGSATNAYVFGNGPAATQSRVLVASLIFDPAAATADERLRIRIDGAEVDETQTASAGTPATTAFALRDIYLGARAGTSLFGAFDFFRGLQIGRELSASELVLAERWAAQALTQYAYSYTPTQFTDTGTTVSRTTFGDRSTYLETSANASVDYETDATVLEVRTVNTMYSTYPTYTRIGVLVDGVYTDSIDPGRFGEGANRITLPSGTKTVSLVNGPQSKPSATLLGSWVNQVNANGAMTQVNLTPTARVLVYGDSIVSGSAASPIQQNAWITLVRAAHYPNSLAVEGWGYRSLHDDCVDATARAAFVAKVVAYAPESIWLAIGVNDYGLNKWTAAAFGTAYAALLDDLNTALPSSVIYAQTPILRATETANGSGSTLGDYRTQIATAQSTRSAYCTLVDGTAFMTTASLSDGVHPTTAGHALYADAVKTALGIA